MYFPKRGRPPYQAVVYFPGSGALTQRSSSQINPRLFDWIVTSGRALIFPIYKSTYERGDGLESDYPNRTIAFRDHVIAWAKDVRRAVDYLESRSDIDRDRMAFMGSELGRRDGADLRRRRAAIQGGGPDRRRVLPPALAAGS